MDISTLKNRINSNLPIYLGDIEVNIIEIFDIFNLIEIDLKEGNKNMIVDVLTLTENPVKNVSIRLNLFIKEEDYRC
ncbi:hypothetical protein [Turicibacter sanguinis]|uniref:hypothetical protein n=1 Tax=Turicibacter sanguinis TaxID=154288 RepID=UPI00241C10FF|nr:hypothetical protein [Turicibacter sanguinis]